MGKIIFRAAAGIVLLSLLLGGIGFAAGWFREGARVVGVENVKAQWQFAYDYNESLGAIATNYCAAKQAESEQTDPSIRVQFTSQVLAHSANYSRVASEYNGRLDDAFRAKLVAPPDVPRQAPSLTDKVAELRVDDPGLRCG